MAVNAAQGRDEREAILTVLRQHWSDLEQQGVKSAAVFGSAARNELSANSDVDILVEFNRQVGLFEFVRLKLHMEKSFIHTQKCRLTPINPAADTYHFKGRRVR